MNKICFLIVPYDQYWTVNIFYDLVGDIIEEKSLPISGWVRAHDD